MNIKLALLGLTAIALFNGCAPMPQQNVTGPSTAELRHMTPASLFRVLGPPSRLEFNKTVFAYGPEGWVKGCQGYGYYIINPDGHVGLWIFYYKHQKWISEHWTISSEKFRRLDWNNSRDRILIKSYQTVHPQEN